MTLPYLVRTTKVTIVEKAIIYLSLNGIIVFSTACKKPGTYEVTDTINHPTTNEPMYYVCTYKDTKRYTTPPPVVNTIEYNSWMVMTSGVTSAEQMISVYRLNRI